MKRTAVFLILASVLALTPKSAYGYDDVYTHSLVQSNKIALTFDDGPHCQYTEQILQILGEYGVRATFFVIGCNAEQYPEKVKAIHDAGHEIGNHTYSHKNPIGYDELNEEIKRSADIIENITGTRPTIFRPPEGKCSELTVSCARKNNCRVILWNIDTLDWKHRPSLSIARDIMNQVKGGDIVLFHDYITPDTPTPDALRKIIPALKEKGYEFCTVSEIISGQ